MRRHAKQLKELHNFDITLTGDIGEILDDLESWAEKTAENAIIAELPRYKKAKKLGEKFAREITD